MLRDPLVCGVNNDQIQKRLLAEPELAYKRAFELATAMETASKNIKEIQGTSLAGINKMQPQPEERGAPCYRCGGGHTAAQCCFKDVECRYCKKVGHIARVCGAKDRQGSQLRGGSTTPRQTHQGGGVA